MANITLENQPQIWLRAIRQKSPVVVQYVMDYLLEHAKDAGQQMVVIGMTYDMPDHIYRVFKLYKFPPGIRVIFHRDMRTGDIWVTRIGWRDDDPYADGH